MPVKANNPDSVDKVRVLQRKLYMAAKEKPTRRFHALLDRIGRWDVLQRAWELVRANKGSAGVDGETIAEIERQGVEGILRDLQCRLLEGRYRPQPVRRVHIPKPDGRRRPLGIPCVRDRILQMAAKIVLEPIFEADFLPVSFGFRPKRSAHQAVECLRKSLNKGFTWVLDLDISAYFDSIGQDILVHWFDEWRSGSVAAGSSSSFGSGSVPVSSKRARCGLRWQAPLRAAS